MPFASNYIIAIIIADVSSNYIYLYDAMPFVYSMFIFEPEPTYTTMNYSKSSRNDRDSIDELARWLMLRTNVGTIYELRRMRSFNEIETIRFDDGRWEATVRSLRD